jgi:hypothetical protein
LGGRGHQSLDRLYSPVIRHVLQVWCNWKRLFAASAKTVAGMIKSNAQAGSPKK